MQKLALLLLAVAGTVVFAGGAHAQGAQSQKTKPKHVVASGETLSSIAAENKLDSWHPIWNANTEVVNPDQINIGQELVVPEPSETTKDRPLPAGYGEAQTAVSYSPASYKAPVYRSSAAPSGDVFARIRARESGGNYATNTGNGYYGAYQFDDGTWGGYGGYRHASDAPADIQDAKAAETYARRGCSPWPSTCY